MWRNLLWMNAAVTLVLVGLIWTVQVVHYPRIRTLAWTARAAVLAWMLWPLPTPWSAPAEPLICPCSEGCPR